jgi:hypothetical protein
MRALIDGVEGAAVTLMNNSTASMKGIVITDDGVNIDLTGDTVAIEVYPTSIRSGSPVTTWSGALSVPAGGSFTVSLTPVINNLGVGTKYGYVKRTHGAEVYYASVPITFTVK